MATAGVQHAQDAAEALDGCGRDGLTEGGSQDKEESANKNGVTFDRTESNVEKGHAVGSHTSVDDGKCNEDSAVSSSRAKDNEWNGVAAGTDGHSDAGKEGEDGEEASQNNEISQNDDGSQKHDGNQNHEESQNHDGKELDDGDDDEEEEREQDDSDDDEDEGDSVSQFVVDEYGNKRELSAYERMRLERIRRNQLYLAKLGLDEAKASNLMEKKKALKRSQSSNSAKETEEDEAEGDNLDDEDITQRRKSSRRTRTVDYSELPSRSRKEDEHRENDETADDVKSEVKSTPTVEKSKKKKESMNAVIFLEFKRLEKERRLVVKTAERDLRSALVEHRYAKRHALAAEKKLEQRRLTLLWDDVELKKAKILASVKKYDLKREMKWMVAQTRHTQFKNSQREAIAALPTVIPCIEQTFDQLLLERCPQDFDPVFLEESLSYRRRRPKRKRKQPDPGTESAKDAPLEAKGDKGSTATPPAVRVPHSAKRKTEDSSALEKDAAGPLVSFSRGSENTDAKPKPRRPEKRKANEVSGHEAALGINETKFSRAEEGQDSDEPLSKTRRRSRGRAPKSKESDSFTVSFEGAEKYSSEMMDDPEDTCEVEQATKKKESKTQGAKGSIRLVAGPVSVEFGNKIDRTWLLGDAFQPVTAQKLSTYVPQAGDLVLYYPIGHSEFMKKNPDQRPNRCRSKLRTPLWSRTSAGQTKKTKRDGVEEQGAKKAKGSSSVSPVETDCEEATNSTWWNQAWLSSLFDGANAKYPILCRVESTIAEFPHNPLAKEDGSMKNGMPVEKPSSSPKRKKKLLGPPLMMSVTLKPLAPVLPPNAGHNLQPPPTLTVIMFPSDLPPYIVPFLWAFDAWQALRLGECVEVQRVGRRQVGKVMSLDGESLSGATDELAGMLHKFAQLSKEDSEEQLLDDIVLSYGLGRKATPSCIDFPPVVLRALVRLLRVRLSSEKCDADVSCGAAVNMQTHGSFALAISNVLRQTLPLWEGVNIELADGSHLKASVWELTRRKGEPITNGTFPESSAERFGHVCCFDSNLRAEIEAMIRTYLKGNEVAEPFVSPITNDIAPCYHCFVPVMMCFRRILRRLRCSPIKLETDKKNAPKQKSDDNVFCYYRSVASVLSDVAALSMNCILYNEPESEIVRNAQIVASEVKKQIIMLETARNREQKEKEKESLNKLKEREAEGQKKSDGDAGASDDAANQSKVGKRVISFNVPLDRTWMESMGPDDSWGSKARLTAAQGRERFGDTADVQGFSSTPWFPQTGDQILYCPERHKDFVSRHSRSLSVEQRNVPHVYPRKNGTKETAPTVEASAALNIEGNSAENQTPKWLVGCILWTSASFPPKPTKSRVESGFEVLTPILAIAFHLQYPWAAGKTYVVHWRPCKLQRSSRQKKTADESTTTGEAQTDSSPTSCSICGLRINESFIRPAWIGPLLNVVPAETAAPPYLIPQGLPCRDRIGACLELLKQRCVQGVPPDSTDSGSTAKRLKTPYVNLDDISITPEALAYTDESSPNGLQKEMGTVATRHGGERLKNNIRTTLAKVHFLPPWLTPASDEFHGVQSGTTDPKDPKLSRHMAVLPVPHLSLELILCRVRNGYYRHALAAINDIREAYVTSVLYVLSGRTVAQGGKALSSRLILSQLIGMPMPSIQPTDDVDSSQSASVDDADDQRTNELSAKDLELVACFKQVRRLYATAVLCVTKLQTAEFAFGIVQSPANRRPTPEEVALESRRAAARKIVEGIVAPLIGDKFEYRLHSADVRKVTLTLRLKDSAPSASRETPVGAKDGENADEGSSGLCSGSECFPPIILKGDDFDASPGLVGAFFKRGNLKDCCLRCKLGRRGMFYCRVRKGHSNPDWGEAISNLEEAGGIDNILGQLLPDECDRAEVAREVAGFGFGISPFAALALRPNVNGANGATAPYATMMNPQMATFAGAAQVAGLALKHDAKAPALVAMPTTSLLNLQTVSVGAVGSGAASFAGPTVTQFIPPVLPDAKLMSSQVAADEGVGSWASSAAKLSLKQDDTKVSDTVVSTAGGEADPQKESGPDTVSMANDNTATGEAGSQKESGADAVASTADARKESGADDSKSGPDGNTAASETDSRKESGADAVASTADGNTAASETDSRKESGANAVKSAADGNTAAGEVDPPKESGADAVKSAADGNTAAGEMDSPKESGADAVKSAADGNTAAAETDSPKESGGDALATEAEAKSETTLKQKEESPESKLIALFAKAERALELAQLAIEEANKDIDAPIRLSDKFIKSSFPYDPADAHYEYCVICARSGDVICCETCPYVAHPGCVGLEKVPDEDWFCHKCTREKQQQGDAKSPEEVVAESRAARRKTMLELLEELKIARLGPAKAAKASKEKNESVPEEEPKATSKEDTTEEAGDKLNGADDDDDDDDEVIVVKKRSKKSTDGDGVASEKKRPRKQSTEDESDGVELGARIMKRFEEYGDYQGVVTCLPSEDNPYYRVRYEDGDEEDMSEDEVCESASYWQEKSSKEDLREKPCKRKRGRPRKDSRVSQLEVVTSMVKRPHTPEVTSAKKKLKKVPIFKTPPAVAKTPGSKVNSEPLLPAKTEKKGEARGQSPPPSAAKSGTRSSSRHRTPPDRLQAGSSFFF